MPWDLCPHINSEKSTVTIRTEKRKVDKPVIIISGIKIEKTDNKKQVLKSITSFFKTSLCCGGSSKNGEILLQTKNIEYVEAQLKETFGLENIQVQE